MINRLSNGFILDGLFILNYTLESKRKVDLP